MRLDNCPHTQSITLIFPKSAPTFPKSVSISKICTSGDLHNLLPTQERLYRVLPNKVLSPTCVLCPQAIFGDQLHSLILCPFNNGVGLWLYRCIRQLFPALESPQLISLNFETNYKSEKIFSAIWMIAKTLLIIWSSRTSNTVNTITITRASLEAEIMLLRKTRFRSHADGLKNLITL